YFLVNKPTGVVSTSRDPSGRPRVIDLLPSDERLFTVGRLDLSSEGLILATNDGELANRLAHPRYGVEKTYHAQVVGVPERETLDRLRQGVHLAEGFAHAKRVTVKSQHKQSALLEIVLDEGRNREVRRLLARVGHKVLRLKRVGLGPLRLGDLAVGEFRPLRREEIRALKESAGPESGRSPLPDGTSSNAAGAGGIGPNTIREVHPSAGSARQAGRTRPHRRRARRPAHGHRGSPR
ncbi:MAG TPA: pseudouridine synthase, partial [Pirellulales bacterium]|nr:pseudouridine synthase [Pirellulales bacterium]